MPNTSPLNKWLPAQKQLQPGPLEFQSLLDLLPYPALAVNLSLGTIRQANQKAVELTGLTRQELIDRPLSVLFPPELTKNLAEKPSFQLSRLTRHLAPAIDVYVELLSLGEAGFWQVLRVENALDYDRNRQDQMQRERLMKQLDSFTSAFFADGYQQTIQILIQSTQELTSAKAVGFYQACSDTPDTLLQFSAGPEANHLPARVSAHDLAFMKSPVVWPQPHSSRLELQRSLRTAGFRGMISAPLGSANAFTGLILAVDSTEFSPETREIIQAVAAASSMVLDHHAHVSNLIRQLQQTTEEMLPYQKAWNQVSDSIVLLDSELTILDINHAAELSLGYSRREVKGLKAENVFISDSPLDNFYNSIRKGTSLSSPPIRLFRRNGSPFQTIFQILPINIEDVTRRIIIVFQDLTEKEQARLHNELLEQRALLGEVTASFAHEVRNPINNISTGLQALEICLPKDDPNQSQIQRMQQDCNRLNDLIKSSLSFIKPVEYNPTKLDMNVLLKSLLDRWQPRLVRNQTRLIFQPDPNPATIEGDERALEQIFNNLFINALQAMKDENPTESSGVLGVKVRRIGQVGLNDQIEISVSDTGSGIPDHVRDHIFEPFFTTKTGGTGLGLPIVKRIVTAHKGAIQVHSIPGATVFTMQFPAI